MKELVNRQDEGLAYMLRYENIAWYEEGIVRILDRRIYPIRTEHVICRTSGEVAEAIARMVTQSEGPYMAAAMGMVLALFEVRDKDKDAILFHMEEASHGLSHARPTTFRQMEEITQGALRIVKEGLQKDKEISGLLEELFQYAYRYVNEKYKRYSQIGRLLAEKIPDKGTVLTQCFAGTVVGTFLRECRRMNKELSLYCAETRPYYQGSRLTASVACDMGFCVYVICDNMSAYTMQKKGIDVFTSASDVITMDGHVINKVGTFPMAMAAKYFGIPYYVTGTPDASHPLTDSVTIEERSPHLVNESMGQRISMEGVGGYYPAFDITPPDFVTGIVTEKGIYSPEHVGKYFEKEGAL